MHFPTYNTSSTTLSLKDPRKLRSDHVSSGLLQEVKNNENFNAVTSKGFRLRELPAIGL